ncbi:enoyl-CoA hydratase-related protein [Arthrobacter sp. ISL-5]|uniref:enoyl-CoA hydratase-related protein n=1 Tax=Arthrobacter sp. ISL-5 TaxID=2819111 RepID=UPI001BE73880|nr:enoyl-CoA hydratase-related protein [Arthrobacter sp. ISL-5]MBT2554172.1 enoyl-CoA hydratase/isomerase family protein [Arthrobacter sp. ISL-5]
MTVVTEVRDRVLIIRIERENKRNAIDRETSLELDAALNHLEDEPELWAGVLTGTPNIFSAGSDLRNAPGETVTPRGGEYGLIRRQRTKPLVAAVEGVAFGGGFEIALACDLIVASTTAQFSFPEVNRGVLAASGGLFRAVRALPLHIAKELLLTGAVLEPVRAQQFGLINRVTSAGGAEEEAVALAKEICCASPISVRATLAAVAEVVEQDNELGWSATSRAFSIVREGPDEKEGINAFFEKRPPRWSVPR